MSKTTYDQELERTGFLTYVTSGRSMRPFLRSGEDLVVLEAVKTRPPELYDAVLYRRRSGAYVLHRIVGVQGDTFTLCGDNCYAREPGIHRSQVLGVLTAVIRKGKRVDADARGYRFWVGLWCALYPARAVILYLQEKLWNLWTKIKSPPEA